MTRSKRVCMSDPSIDHASQYGASPVLTAGNLTVSVRRDIAELFQFAVRKEINVKVVAASAVRLVPSCGLAAPLSSHVPSP